jgi:hypothetical protein
MPGTESTDPDDEKKSRRQLLGLILALVLILLLCGAAGALAAFNRETGGPVATEEPGVVDTPTNTDEPDEPDDPTATNTEEPTVTTCECVGPDFVCEDGTVTKEDATCKGSCACDGADYFCEDGTVIKNYSACEPVNTGGGRPGTGGTCVLEQTCGDGTCNPTCENSDLCPADCGCVDNGVKDPGEGCNCRDVVCEGEDPGTVCGGPCGAGGTCAAGLECTSAGICWSNTICQPGGDPGGGETVEEQPNCVQVCVQWSFVAFPATCLQWATVCR